MLLRNPQINVTFKLRATVAYQPSMMSIIVVYNEWSLYTFFINLISTMTISLGIINQLDPIEDSIKWPIIVVSNNWTSNKYLILLI